MKYGISGTHLPANFPFAVTFNMIAGTKGFFPCVLGAVAWEETLKVLTPAQAMPYISSDNGHGIFQLTDSWPKDWQVPSSSAAYACDDYLLPALKQWTTQTTLQGDDLIRAVAATYNAGWQNAWDGHLNGNVDEYTTNQDYGTRVLADYHTLVAGLIPAGVSNPNPS